MQQNNNKSQGKKGNPSPQKIWANDFFKNNLHFEEKWIQVNADKQLVQFASEAGKYMAKNGLTNSKIRSIYGEIKRIQMGVFEQEKPSFYLLKPKVAYELGRDQKNEGLKLFKIIFDKCFDIVEDEKTFKNFSNLIEAILAYHKAYGGKEL